MLTHHLFPGKLDPVAEVEWLDADEQRAWRSLQFMQMRLERALARQLADDSGLSYPDYVVLVALSDHDDGRLRSFELGDVLGWEKSRLSHQVGRMAARGLVDREPCDSDRRGAYVVLTDDGLRALRAAAPGHVAAVRRLFLDAVTPEQLAAIGDAAESVLGRLDEEPAEPDRWSTSPSTGRLNRTTSWTDGISPGR